jgi:hypothetical protein
MVFSPALMELGLPADLPGKLLGGFQDNALQITVFVLSLFGYSVMVWHYYRFLAKRDLFSFTKAPENDLMDKYTISSGSWSLRGNTCSFSR